VERAPLLLTFQLFSLLTILFVWQMIVLLTSVRFYELCQLPDSVLFRLLCQRFTSICGTSFAHDFHFAISYCVPDQSHFDNHVSAVMHPFGPFRLMQSYMVECSLTRSVHTPILEFLPTSFSGRLCTGQHLPARAGQCSPGGWLETVCPSTRHFFFSVERVRDWCLQ